MNSNNDINKIILNILEINEPLKLNTTEIMDQLENIGINIKNTTLIMQLNSLYSNGSINRDETPSGIEWSISNKQHRMNLIMTDKTPRINQLEQVFIENPKLIFSIKTIREVTGWEKKVNVNSVLSGLIKRGVVMQVEKDGKRLYKYNASGSKTITAPKKEKKEVTHHGELLPKQPSITDMISTMENERNQYKSIIEEILQVLEKHHVLEE